MLLPFNQRATDRIVLMCPMEERKGRHADERRTTIGSLVSDSRL